MAAEGRSADTADATGGSDRKIDYIEFIVSDIARSKRFYRAAFGWTFTDFGPDYCEFSDGRMTGGFSLRDDDAKAPAVAGGPLVILYADDLPAMLTSVEQAGGRITRPIFPFPGGQRFQFADPDGYELGVWSKD